MSRIYSNYTNEERELIDAAAMKAGMTVSAYCKAAVMEKVAGKTSNTSESLMNTLHKNLKKMKSGDVFIVSDLYSDEVWSNLTRSEKNTISKQLAKNVRENPDQYTVNAVLPGKITQYRKI